VGADLERGVFYDYHRGRSGRVVRTTYKLFAPSVSSRTMTRSPCIFSSNPSQRYFRTIVKMYLVADGREESRYIYDYDARSNTSSYLNMKDPNMAVRLVIKNATIARNIRFMNVVRRDTFLDEYATGIYTQVCDIHMVNRRSYTKSLFKLCPYDHRHFTYIIGKESFLLVHHSCNRLYSKYIRTTGPCGNGAVYYVNPTTMNLYRLQSRIQCDRHVYNLSDTVLDHYFERFEVYTSKLVTIDHVVVDETRIQGLHDVDAVYRILCTDVPFLP
jgi:hypothetical protein